MAVTQNYTSASRLGLLRQNKTSNVGPKPQAESLYFTNSNAIYHDRRQTCRTAHYLTCSQGKKGMNLTQMFSHYVMLPRGSRTHYVYGDFASVAAQCHQLLKDV